MLAACAPTSGADDPAAVPPIDDIERWFAAGHYLAWPCETMPHDSAAHGRIRVCANAIAMTTVDAIDASLVAELVDATGAVTGYAAQRHTAADATGDAWYWYLRDASGVVADGWGFDPTPARDVCAACHQTANDFVFVTP